MFSTEKIEKGIHDYNYIAVKAMIFYKLLLFDVQRVEFFVILGPSLMLLPGWYGESSADADGCDAVSIQ